MTFGLNLWKSLQQNRYSKKYTRHNETVRVEGSGHAATIVFNVTHIIGLQVLALSINQ